MTRNKLQEEKKSIMSACNLSYRLKRSGPIFGEKPYSKNRLPIEVDFLSKMIKTQYNATNLSKRFSRNLSKYPNQNS